MMRNTRSRCKGRPQFGWACDSDSFVLHVDTLSPAKSRTGHTSRSTVVATDSAQQRKAQSESPPRRAFQDFLATDAEPGQETDTPSDGPQHTTTKGMSIPKSSSCPHFVIPPLASPPEHHILEAMRKSQHEHTDPLSFIPLPLDINPTSTSTCSSPILITPSSDPLHHHDRAILSSSLDSFHCTTNTMSTSAITASANTDLLSCGPNKTAAAGLSGPDDTPIMLPPPPPLGRVQSS